MIQYILFINEIYIEYKIILNLMNITEIDLHYFQIQKIKDICLYLTNPFELLIVLDKLLLEKNNENYKILLSTLNDYDIKLLLYNGISDINTPP